MRRARVVVVGMCVAAGIMLASPAFATSIVFKATLDPIQAGGGARQGSGFATVTLDDVLDIVDVTVSFSGITTPATAAHIHCCALPGTNAGVVVPFPGFPNATAGIYVANNLAISLANITGLENGLAYVNIHDATFPGGEIRGQLGPAAPEAVPEPATLTLLGLGLGAGVVRRRRSALS